MKKLIIILFLLIAGIAKSQTYKADSLAYFSNPYNLIPDTLLGDDITIVIEKGYIYIDKWNAHFEARITDTLPQNRSKPPIVDKIFKLKAIPKAYKGEEYILILIMSYVNNELITIGLLHGEQLFIYRITNELIDG